MATSPSENSFFRDDDDQPKQRNALTRFFSSITKTRTRRFLTVLALSLVFSAVLLALMFTMPQLMIGLTMALGAAAIWLIPATFAAQIAVFVTSIVAASAVLTTFFWGMGELLGLGARKCVGDDDDYESLPQNVVSFSAEPSVNLDEGGEESSVRSNAEAERIPVLEEDEADKQQPPTEKPPTPPRSGTGFFGASSPQDDAGSANPVSEGSALKN